MGLGRLVPTPREYRRTKASQYWCAILCGLGFVFLLFCMEETNYNGKTLSYNDAEKSPHLAQTENSHAGGDPQPTVDSDSPRLLYTKRYLQKLKVLDSKLLDRPNRLKGMLLRPLIFLTFPVIFYSGFSYGSNLVWFNVLNGTASLILSGKSYGFSSSMVGLSYLSPLLGASLS